MNQPSAYSPFTLLFFFFFNDTAPPEIYTLPLHDALPIFPATELPADTPSWPSDDPDLLERVEDRLARDLGLSPGELFLDFPAKAAMLALDLPLVKRDGSVTQLGGVEAAAHLGLPRVAAELYRSARRLRVFVLGEARVEAKRVVELVMLPREAVASMVEEGRPMIRG